MCNDWAETEYIIYDDYSLVINNYYCNGIVIKVKGLNISKSDFKKIKKIMEKLAENEPEIDADDGEAWEFKYYKDNKLYKKRKKIQRDNR